jgi:hypothetical protein
MVRCVTSLVILRRSAQSAPLAPRKAVSVASFTTWAVGVERTSFEGPRLVPRLSPFPI